MLEIDDLSGLLRKMADSVEKSKFDDLTPMKKGLIVVKVLSGLTKAFAEAMEKEVE